mmetsp:Transcript_13846/g.25425  ORF Transcript_13846/g.25425 Transcript_13846/m.25425 type:complete len:391 (-) Transcript_13846:86-1258(-)
MVQVEEYDEEAEEQGEVEQEEGEEEEEEPPPDGIIAFLDFDWSHDGWQKYLEGLYPPPNPRQLLKFKKKWYKRNIDPDFDDNHPAVQPPPEPAKPAAAAAASVPPTDDAAPAASDAAAEPTEGFTSGGSSSSGGGSTSSTKRPKIQVPNPFVVAAGADGSRWATMGQKTSICFFAYLVSMFAAVAASVDVLPSYQALLLLMAAFSLEILAKYGLKFKSEWLHSLLLDDVGVMPMMILTLLTPGMHYLIRVLALAVPLLTALLTFAQICQHHKSLPSQVKDFLAPLVHTSARYQVMAFRAQLELALGLALVIGVFTMRAAPFSALLFWNFMMMRFMMNPWTQEAFRQFDRFVTPQVQPVYPLRRGYRGLKKFLYSFVDPEARKKGSFCTIL